ISGAVVAINSGGGFAPGPASGIGTLTISNNLALASGSTTFVRVQHSPPTNTAARITGSLIEAGTLNVTNIGGALANGDTFKLFNAGSYLGSFANFVLPALPTNLVWNTYTLSGSGTLSVVSLTPPVISSLNVSGGNLTITGTGGASSWP